MRMAPRQNFVKNNRKIDGMISIIFQAFLFQELVPTSLHRWLRLGFVQC